MSDSGDSGLMGQLFEWLYQLVFLLMFAGVLVDSVFHPSDPLIFVLLMPIGIALVLGLFWLIAVVAGVLGGVFDTLKARWRRRQRGW